MSIIDIFDRAPLSAIAIAARIRASRRIPIDTDCRTPGGVHVVTVVGPPDEHNRHPVRLALADGQTREFSLPAISLTPVGEEAR